MMALAGQLSNFLGCPVTHKTGLTGPYVLELEWVPDESQVAMFSTMGCPRVFGPPAPDWPGPTLFAALLEWLGLKLDSRGVSGERL